MDIIVGLSKFEECGSIMVVVDMFNKCTTFILISTNYQVDEVTHLSHKHIVKL